MGFPSYDKRSLFIPVGVSPCVYIPMTPVCRRFCRFRSPLISLAWLYLLHIFGSFSSPISVHLRCAAIPANGKLAALFASGGFLASRHEIWFGVTPHSAQQHNRSIFFRFEQHFNNVLKSRQRAVDTATGDGQRERQRWTLTSTHKFLQWQERSESKIYICIRQNRTMHTLLSFALDVSSEQW